MASHQMGLDARFVFKHPPHQITDEKKGWLGIICLPQLFLRAIKTHITYGKSKSVIGPGKIFSHKINIIIQILSHSDIL